MAYQGQGASIFHGLTGQGGSRTQGDNTRSSGPGAGGSSYAYYAYTISNQQMSPGLFGGGGGGIPNWSGSSGHNNPGYSGAGHFGGGGGAIAGYQSAGLAFNSGAGGSGLVVVTILEAL